MKISDRLTLLFAITAVAMMFGAAVLYRASAEKRSPDPTAQVSS